jgi:hypothetical protein
LAELVSSGATMRGLVLWDREDPIPSAVAPGPRKRLELMG